MGLFQVTVNRLGHLLEGGASELMNILNAFTYDSRNVQHLSCNYGPDLGT